MTNVFPGSIVDQIQQQVTAINSIGDGLEDWASGVSTSISDQSDDINDLLTRMSDAETAIAGKALLSHSHVIDDISNAGTVGKLLMAAGDKATALAAIMITGAHIADGATNSPTDAPTNLNVLTTLLGALTGEVNATNARQNTIATNLNALATKFNTMLDSLESNKVLAS